MYWICRGNFYAGAILYENKPTIIGKQHGKRSMFCIDGLFLKLNIHPLGKGELSVVKFVKQVHIHLMKDENLNFELGKECVVEFRNTEKCKGFAFYVGDAQ